MNKAALITLIIALLLIGGGAAFYFMSFPLRVASELKQANVGTSTLVSQTSSSTSSTSSIATNCAKLINVQDKKYVNVEDSHLVQLEDLNGNSYSANAYYRDSCHVYMGSGGIDAEIVERADPKTFKLLIIAYLTDPKCETSCIRVSVGKDATHVFADGKIVDGVDSSSFVMLTTPDGEVSMYGKDYRHVYMFDTAATLLQGADAITFTATQATKAEDKVRKYSYSE